jgi:sigma-B regulation protein RsbU (phosphoserine phosphatase)
MSHLQASVRAFASGRAAPEAVVASVNAALCRQGDLHRFVTLFYSVFDTETRVLSYCNAGHNAPVLLRRGGAVERLEVGGTVAGVFEEAGYEAGKVRLEPGDRLVLFTDGVTEARSADDHEFGDARLTDWLAAARHLAPAAAVERLFSALRAFCPGGPQDDATAMVLDVG